MSLTWDFSVFVYDLDRVVITKISNSGGAICVLGRLGCYTDYSAKAYVCTDLDVWIHKGQNRAGTPPSVLPVLPFHIQQAVSAIIIPYSLFVRMSCIFTA
jgi:hypothetical protein